MFLRERAPLWLGAFLVALLVMAGCNGESASGTDPAVTPTPGAATPGAAADGPGIEFSSEDVKKGEGKAVDKEGAFEASIKVWGDRYEGTPWGKGELKLVVAPAQTPLPGIARLCEGMKEGGVRRGSMTAKDLFGTIPAGAPLKPNQPFYMEAKVEKVFEPQPLKQEIVKKGSGDWSATKGDVVKVEYTGWLDKFESGKEFDSSKGRAPFVMTVGGNQVIPGWEMAIEGMKKGEVKRITVPHFLAYGGEEHNKIPPYSTLYFQIEMLGKVEEGKLESKTIKEGSGEPAKTGEKVRVHYSGWLDGFDGKQQFDSSRKREPFEFVLGQGSVIKGWDEGVVGMKPGEIRHLTIPYNLAYGPNGRPPTIPPYSTLFFEVEYLGPATAKPAGK